MEDRELYEKRVGTTLRGKWTLERLLGVGGMAAVYVGLHKVGHRDAIKILHPDAADSPEMRARFEQEAYALNQLDHPGVVRVRDVDVTDDGAPFLVMDLLEGEPLSAKAKREGGVEIGELLRIVDELLDVLAAAHDRGIVHRDIKLDNLFILRDGRLKVLDFGIAHMRRSSSFGKMTRMGARLGTAPYMAPEQAKGLPIDGRTDIFAVGATMFRLIAKRRVHEAPNEQEMMILMASEPAPSLASVAPDTPPHVVLIVDRALAFNREQRYPDAGTMQRDVQAVRRGEPPPYATARLAEDKLHGEGRAESGRQGAASSSFADMPTVVPGKAARLAVTADMAPSPEAFGHPEHFEPNRSTPTPNRLTPTASPSDPPRSAPPDKAKLESVPPPPSPRLRLPLIAAAVLLVIAVVGAGLRWALYSEVHDHIPRPGSAPHLPSAPPPAPSR